MISGILTGKYLGERIVRPGREHELSREEFKRLVRENGSLTLDIRQNGTYTYKGISHGTWSLNNGVVRFQPLSFGTQTREQMREAAESLGRVFTLGFLFESFQLVLRGEDLVSCEDWRVVYTVFRRQHGQNKKDL